MTSPAIPTMHLSESWLTDPREKILYILRHFTCIPSGVSRTFYDYEISFQKLESEHGSNSVGMAAAVSSALQEVYKRLFPNDFVVVNVTPIELDSIRYNLQIAVNITIDGFLVDVSGTIDITSDKQITFKPSQGEVF